MTREEVSIVLESLSYDLWAELSDRQRDALDMAIEALKEQRPHGEWKQISEPDIEGKVTFECSNCGYYHKHHERLVVNFCECCGAEMGNVQEEFARISKELFVGLDMLSDMREGESE